MKGAKRILRAGLLLALLPAAGCLSPHRSAVADVDPLGWREAAEPLLCDTAVLYRRRAVLRCAGDYRMTIRPCRPVRGIEAVGVTIEKSI